MAGGSQWTLKAWADKKFKKRRLKRDRNKTQRRLKGDAKKTQRRLTGDTQEAQRRLKGEPKEAHKSRTTLNLNWRPREENTEADDLTNEIFEGFDPALRLAVKLKDLDLTILHALVAVHSEFEEAKKAAKADRARDPASKSKKFDKSPW